MISIITPVCGSQTAYIARRGARPPICPASCRQTTGSSDGQTIQPLRHQTTSPPSRCALAQRYTAMSACIIPPLSRHSGMMPQHPAGPGFE
ncbi:MAG TPA: hypothetical protein PKG95_03455 [Anaerolineaceae bacterium]|nr:hypothetical protein [Anaerolineaceae bacterium]